MSMTIAIELLASGMALEARRSLQILVLALVGWTLTSLDDTFVAVTSAVAMTLFVTGKPEALFGTLGDQLIWLLLASFLLAAAFKASGITDQLIALAAGRLRSVQSLAYVLTAILLATAFVIPSTSGRAAMMVPAYAAIAGNCTSARVRRAFALLFPTIVLLSAFASPIGAGAHLVAIDMVQRLSGQEIGYLDWVVLGLPFAASSVFLSTSIILRLFLTAQERRGMLVLPPNSLKREPLPRQPIFWIAAAVVTGWLTEPMHGIDPTILALIGALAVFFPGVGSISFRDALRDVDLSLLVFLAAMICLADGFVTSGLNESLVTMVFRPLRAGELPSIMFIALVAMIGLLSHLIIHSRTARVSILLPPTLILAQASGADAVMVMLTLVSATGLCQTLMVSAKPVALFGRLEENAYSAGDLVRLSAVLMPVHFLLIMAFVLIVWPAIELMLV
ncbi:ArsB/NhaD family transporter permease protein (plasmid) [Rhizobium gallicum bv. gallicum R602sp]|uniref:ArsB/NhaD family transporter permease protein n=2 Tax=Rhizobium/Agrobacterium group TaxID=227290 RepID=A0A0B4XC17_9HYPH|nr:ArsB/NhaD family transporter permease protein [Rhizobium gallicum bv. gallicum R602sp]